MLKMLISWLEDKSSEVFHTNIELPQT